MTTYHKLGTSRNVIQGYIGYIPFTEYKAYFEIFNPLDDINETMDILMEMDHMFVLARNKD